MLKKSQLHEYQIKGVNHILNDLFYYIDGKLYNKINRNPRATINSEAGSFHHSGYMQVRIFGKIYLNHRIIWAMFNGDIPDNMEIDHIDHNRLNNKIDNLRLVTRSGNRRNTSLSSKNTSGHVGVYFINRLGKWGAQIKVNGSVIWLGVYLNLSDAIKVRKEAELKHSFHKNHGKV